ncbi:Helix-hairpin-helix motif protein [Tsuneonella dongtanensis]|uniref:Helix-hairpin-helix motif protein n=1 Tax=Tsuneonella dongtanensis TaxID=692370 RepID=A0A1B2ABY1_9SPHN|nr:helix-hairpin-helix domain-containing protein [Tsuneonella dongtanensis]ANY19672.1 Helix-hairpin-helix motif protein [Tsuneonella dongtanensis]
MRKIVMASVLAGSVAVLAACSGGADEATVEGETAAPAATETVAAAPVAPTIVDANTATEQQLAGIAGVTPEIAKAIVDGRPYADVVAFDAALKKVMAPEAATSLLRQLFVPVNLNTASEDAIKLIPGMTDKMVGEFLEYRPYADMAEFDREIGKYVDEAEVARLRSYTTL